MACRRRSCPSSARWQPTRPISRNRFLPERRGSAQRTRAVFIFTHSPHLTLCPWNEIPIHFCCKGTKGGKGRRAGKGLLPRQVFRRRCLRGLVLPLLS